MIETFSLLIHSNIDDMSSRFPLANFMYHTLRIVAPKKAKSFLNEFFEKNNEYLTFLDTQFSRRNVHAWMRKNDLPPDNRPDLLLTSPKVWGPKVWQTLFALTKKFAPDKHSDDIQILILYMPYVIPCPECAMNFYKLLEEMPPPISFKAKAAVEKYISALHARVAQHATKK